MRYSYSGSSRSSGFFFCPEDLLPADEHHGEHQQEADTVGAIDYPHIPPDFEKPLTPQHSEYSIADESTDHGIGGIAQPFQGAEVHLIDGIESISRQNPQDGGYGMM